MESIEERASSPVITSLCALHNWTAQRCSRSYTEKRREEGGDIGGQEDNRRESKGERQNQPVISSLSVLHSPEHTKRFTELGREERGREETEATWWSKRESKDGESSQASNLTPK